MAVSITILSTEVAHKGKILSKPNHLKTWFYSCHSVKHIIVISLKGKKNVSNAYKVYDSYFPKIFEGSLFLYIINLLI